jgi:hypothetical protein
MTDLTKCVAKQHPLIELRRFSGGYDTDTVVCWCPECGAVVIDYETDCRTNPGGAMGMKIPNIYKDYLKVPR